MDHVNDANDKELEALATEYGFFRVLQSDAMRNNPKIKLFNLAKARNSLESLARILSLTLPTTMEHARQQCGLSKTLTLKFAKPEEMSFETANYLPAIQTIRISDRPIEHIPAASHFGHEWAHALDYKIGMSHLAPPSGSASKAAADTSPLKTLAREMVESPAPYHAAMGTIARLWANNQNGLARVASIEAAKEPINPKLPAFYALIQNMLPKNVLAMGRPAKKFRFKESSMQRNKILSFVEQSAYECLRDDPDIISRSLPEKQIKTLARFCAVAVEQQSEKESTQRRGREKTIDSVKHDISTILGRSLRFDEPTSNRIASSLMHIASIKERFDDPEFSAPYTGRSTWSSPGSLADLSCALVRVCRNQRALSNSHLAKERFVPMAFWWSMRRQISINSDIVGSRANQAIHDLAAAGVLPDTLAVHASDWRNERGDYKAGALAFSDLVGTGSKMIQEEAALAGSSMDDKSARSLRRKITAPLNEMTQRSTVKESFAESFEQFIIAQSLLPTRLGKACKIAVEADLVDADPDERSAATDTSLSWLNNKDGDVDSVVKYWKKILRELGSPEFLGAPQNTPNTATSHFQP